MLPSRGVGLVLLKEQKSVTEEYGMVSVQQRVRSKDQAETGESGPGLSS